MSVRSMPAPFFRGNKFAMTICDIVKGRGGTDRALNEGERRLGGWILPPFQRPQVWTQAQQIAFIESLWLELPVGSLVWNALWAGNAGPCDNWLLDGQQRMTAMLAYMNDEFPVLGSLFSQIEDRDRRRWDFGMPIAVIETQVTDPDMCLEIYNRLAYGGTPHERA